MLVEGGAADQILGHVEAGDPALVEPFDDAPDLAHHLGADAVAGEQRIFRFAAIAVRPFRSEPGLAQRRFDSKEAIVVSFCRVRPISSSPFNRQCLRIGIDLEMDHAAIGPRDRLLLADRR